MAYMDGNNPAPFGAITIFRATNAVSEAVGGLRAAIAGHARALSAFSPSQREDMGFGAEHLRASARPGLTARILTGVREWNARRRTVAELSRLSDAQLEDIGLTRADVDAVRAGRRLG